MKFGNDGGRTDRYTTPLYRALADMKKRFIAGVVCPKCGEQDSIKAWDNIEEELLMRECVDCGFTDRISTSVNLPKELSTRVTPTHVSTPSSDTVQVIKILK